MTVLANPVMPFLTDSMENLDSVCGAAAEAGARSFSASPLFLKPCSRAVFMPFIEQRMPHLAAKYRTMYAGNAYLRGAYPETIAERVRTVVAKHRLAPRSASYIPEQFAQSQLSLW